MGCSPTTPSPIGSGLAGLTPSPSTSSASDSPTASATTSLPTPSSTPSPSPSPVLVPAPLTGTLVSPAAAALHPIAVMLD
ncbi:MAG TPA: hypothetical protein VFC81_02175, partial [Verrucomicrobiae bacterium]|nr:hypothetical protein [Verrucomicrobiae bacterium]